MLLELNYTPLIVVGIGGNAREGKGTAADSLADWGFKEYTYAAPVKRMIGELLDMPDDPSDEDKTAVIDWIGEGVDRRTLYQLIGTDFGRNRLGEDIWINHLIRRLNVDQPRALLISDIRFPNEADFVRSLGGMLFRIMMPEEESRESREQRIGASLGVGGIPNHESEAYVSTIAWNATITNSGTVSDLRMQLFERLLNQPVFAELMAQTEKTLGSVLCA